MVAPILKGRETLGRQANRVNLQNRVVIRWISGLQSRCSVVSVLDIKLYTKLSTEYEKGIEYSSTGTKYMILKYGTNSVTKRYASTRRSRST